MRAKSPTPKMTIFFGSMRLLSTGGRRLADDEREFPERIVVQERHAGRDVCLAPVEELPGVGVVEIGPAERRIRVRRQEVGRPTAGASRVDRAKSLEQVGAPRLVGGLQPYVEDSARDGEIADGYLGPR